MSKALGPQMSRSETVGVRLDPKLRYLAEIAARIQGRTLSSFIEWSMRRVLTIGEIEDEPVGNDRIPVALRMLGRMAHDELWDTDEAMRFWKLATNPNDLLTIPEQELWAAYSDRGGNINKPEHFKKMWPKLKLEFLEK